MKNSNEWRTTTNITKTSLEVLPGKVTLLGVLVFGPTVDTPKQGIKQHEKWKFLKSVRGSGKAYLLGCKWTQEKINKASDETINKTYDAYKQRELNEKVKKLEKP